MVPTVAFAQAGRLPEGLLAVPLVSTEQAVGALTSIVVRLLQAHLGVLHIGKGDAKNEHSPCMAVGKVQPLRHLTQLRLLNGRNDWTALILAHLPRNVLLKDACADWAPPAYKMCFLHVD